MRPVTLVLRVVVATVSATIGTALSPRYPSNIHHQALRNLGSNRFRRTIHGTSAARASSTLQSCSQRPPGTLAGARNAVAKPDGLCSAVSWSYLSTLADSAAVWGRRDCPSGKRHVLRSLGGGSNAAAAAAPPGSDGELNESQWEAVTAEVGAVRIVAGPGSGKTRVLTQRIAHLVSNVGVPPRSILAVTFTKKAAEEMKARVRKVIGDEVASRVSLGTFHSVCARLLWRHGEALSGIVPGLNGRFSIYDKEDSRRVIKETMEGMGLGIDKLKPKEVCSAISSLKSQGLQPEDIKINPNLSPGRKKHEKAVLEIYSLYQRKLISSNALDFDDVILVALKLLQEDKEVFRAIGRQYRHILVDEWQDTNGPQYQLVLELVRASVDAQDALEETRRAADAAILAAEGGDRAVAQRGSAGGVEAGYRESSGSEPRSTASGGADAPGSPPSIFVVGDSDQCIYRFRGADHNNVARFAEDFPGCHTVHLRENYRSTGNIARAATAVIEKVQQRIKQQTVAVQSEGRPIGVMQCSDDAGEAEAVARQAELYLTSGRVPAAEMAVMYRTNAQSRSFEEAFVRKALPFVVVGAQRFYDRREIKDCLAYLRLVTNPCDAIAMRRAINTPPRGIGPKTELALQALIASARENIPGLEDVNEPECLMALLEDRELDELAEALPRPGEDSSGGEVGWGAFTVPRARAVRKAVEAGDVQGPSKAQMKKLAGFARLLCKLRVVAASQGMPELFGAVVDETDMKSYVTVNLSTTGPSEGNDRWMNVLELERAASHHRFAKMKTPDALETFLRDVALMSSEDVERERERRELERGGGETESSSAGGTSVVPPRIQLMTVHASKGLEFDTVFLTGLEEGTFPILRGSKDVDEERRLMYVGMTRAKARLFLSCRDERVEIASSGFRRVGSSPSRFIGDIPKTIIRTIDRRTPASHVPGRRHPRGSGREVGDYRSGTPRRRGDGERNDGAQGGTARSYSSASLGGALTAGPRSRPRDDASYSPNVTATQLFGDVDTSPKSTRRTLAATAAEEHLQRVRGVEYGDPFDGTQTSSGRSSQGYGDSAGGGARNSGASRSRAAKAATSWAGARDARVFKEIRNELEMKRYPVPVVKDRGARLAEESGEGIDTSWAAKLVNSQTTDISLLAAGVRVGAQVSHPVHGPGEVVALVKDSESVNVRFESKGEPFVTRVLGSKLKVLR